jgi:hypothetical protein
MVATIEKNDVDLSKLLHYGDKFKIVDRTGETILTAYIRLVGDAELNRARIFALRSSADMRSSLKDKDSDLHKAFIPTDDYSASELVDLIVAYSSQNIAKEAIKECKIALPKEPSSEADLEEHENYQKLVDDYPTKRLESIQKSVEKKLTELRENLSKKAKKELYEQYEQTLISIICEQEMISKFKEMCTFFGTFRDKNYTKPLFHSFTEFSNALTDIKQQLMDDYTTLDISNDELKK